MNYNRNKIIQMAAVLALICAVVGMLSKAVRQNSMTLEDYARQNPDVAYQENKADKAGTENAAALEGAGNSGSSSNSENIGNPKDTGNAGNPGNTGNPQNDHSSQSGGANSPSGKDGTSGTSHPASALVGASLNSSVPEEERTLHTEGFYYEPLSENLRRYITGVSYPATDSGAGDSGDSAAAHGDSAAAYGDLASAYGDSASAHGDSAAAHGDLAVTYDDLRYVHIWHYDFEGNPAEGELICNQAVAQDLVEIFYELYFNEYQIEKVLLIDEYDGDDTASMEDNNTSCFNYRVVEGSTSLSKHAYGLAIDINPLYNPYITYNKDGSEKVSPTSALPYADRSGSFPYKIDENDLCYRLFKEHGFTWGGNWNSSKDYQHFQKAQ